MVYSHEITLNNDLGVHATAYELHVIQAVLYTAMHGNDAVSETQLQQRSHPAGYAANGVQRTVQI